MTKMNSNKQIGKGKEMKGFFMKRRGHEGLSVRASNCLSLAGYTKSDVAHFFSYGRSIALLKIKGCGAITYEELAKWVCYNHMKTRPMRCRKTKCKHCVKLKQT